MRVHLCCAECTNIAQTIPSSACAESHRNCYRQRNSVGSEFQTAGPATEKARRSNVVRRHRGSLKLGQHRHIQSCACDDDDEYAHAQYMGELRASFGDAVDMWDHYEVLNKSHVDISNFGEYFVTTVETLLISQRRVHVRVSRPIYAAEPWVAPALCLQ